MIFLNAAAGLTALGVAGALTALLYFLKLRRKPVRVSSTMLWARAARDLEVNAPIQWIRPSWLLLLQLLAVACFAAAVGRPAVTGSEGAPERWVLVIDRSASMGARDGEGGATRLEEARARAETIVRRMGRGERAMVVSFASGARLEAAMTDDRGVLLAAIGAIGQTDEPGAVGGALDLAAAQLGGDPEGARVVLISDGGFESPGGAALGPAAVRFVRAGPAAGEAASNTGVVAVNARRDPDDPARVRAFVRVRHAGDGTREATVTARYTEDGEAALIGSETLEVEAGGDASAVFETRALGGGVLEVEIAGRDALEADDAARVVMGPARGSAALLVHPEEGADPFVRRAVDVATRGNFAEMSEGEWEGGAGAAGTWAYVVFDGVAAAREPRAPSIHLGAGALFAGVGLARYEGEGAARVEAWERRHPALRFVALDAVRLEGPVGLEFEDENGGSAGARAETLAVGEAGPLIVALETGGFRRLVSAVGPRGSNWETDPSFLLFVAVASEWAAPRTTGAGTSHETGAPVSVRALPGREEVAARGPGGEVRRARVRGDGLARFGAFERAGVYGLEGAEAPALAVNLLDEGESAARTADAVDVAGRAVRASGVDAATVRELWRWFVLAGLVIACIEWLVYAKRMRV